MIKRGGSKVEHMRITDNFLLRNLINYITLFTYL